MPQNPHGADEKGIGEIKKKRYGMFYFENVQARINASVCRRRGYKKSDSWEE